MNAVPWLLVLTSSSPVASETVAVQAVRPEVPEPLVKLGLATR